MMAIKYGLKRHKHRCMSCQHLHYNHSLEYYPYYQCAAANYQEISLCTHDGEKDRMKFCPLYGPERDDEEMEIY